MARLKTQAQLEQERQEAVRYTLGAVTLPLDRLLLIYARQSSKKQVVSNVQSAKQQTVDLIERGLEFGWGRDGNADYRLFVENAVTKDGEIRGVSGTLRIDEREGLQTIVDIIKSGQAGAVMAVDVSRFFRGEDLIDATVFAKACKRNRVLVITNDDVFDFNNPHKTDTKRFIDEAAAAAAFIEKHIKGKMLKGRSRKAAREGLLGNGLAPVGLYAVGEKVGERTVHNRLMPSPHAPHVNALYHRFEELGASLANLHKEIIGKPVFPDRPDIDSDSMFLTKVPGGWTVKSRAALKYILSNPVYAGHVVFDGKVVKRDAHPRIVDEGPWLFAFEHLSATDLDGTPIEHSERAVRFTRKGHENVGLLAGVREDGRPVLEGTGGKHVYVQANTSKAGAAYTLKNYHDMSVGYYDAGISVPRLDRIFYAKMMVWLVTDSMAEGPMHAQFTQLDEGATPDTSLNDDMEETRAGLAKVTRRIDVAGDLMTDTELRAAYTSKSRLTRRLAELESKQTSRGAMRAELLAARRDLRDNYKKWDSWDLDRKRRFVRLVTEAITLEQVAEGWLRLTVVWCPLIQWSKGETAYIWRRAGENWTAEETDLLRTHYLTSTKGQLLGLFPTRSWTAISSRWSELDMPGRRGPVRSDTNMPDNMSLSDHDVLERYELAYSANGQRVWWQSLAIEEGNDQSSLVVTDADCSYFIRELRAMLA